MDKSDNIKGGEDNLKPLDSPDKIKDVTNYIEQSAIMEILFIMGGGCLTPGLSSLFLLRLTCGGYSAITATASASG
jgi:Ethanolamine utilization protein EutJ (predicted chaperonin)